MPLWVVSNWKAIALAIALLTAFSTGWYVCELRHDSKELKSVKHRLESVNEGTRKIVEFNQKWGNANVEDECLNSPIPDALRLLLK